LRTSDAAALETQLAVFRSLLQQFAQSHAKDIRSNPSFRAQFARMCAAIGVDPLAASSTREGGGSIWAQLLGRSVNDFYFELAVKVVEVCSMSRGENGGLIEVRKVREAIMKSRMEGAPDVTEYAYPLTPSPTKHQAPPLLTAGLTGMIFFVQLEPSSP
jgi:ESCRT-II complex subunit VPS22